MATDVVTCFLRNRGQVLLNRRAEAAPTFPGRWAGLSGEIEDESPEEAARREIAEETGIADPDLVRGGGTVTVQDGDREWRVHPFLFDVSTRDLADSKEHAETEWVHPPAILRRETVPDLRRAYERVAPTVRTVAADDEHGSAYVSVRALEVLRDRAGLLADEGGDPDEGWAELADLAKRLRSARPEMAALANRVNRAMSEADRDPASVEDRAAEGVDRALAADEAAARNAADRIDGDRVLTLSRSGTVLDALREGDPATVYVAESRPDREGVGVAEALADHTRVILHTDAAVGDVLARREVDCVLMGADTLRPDGGLVNKTGTRTAAVVAAHEDVPVYAVAATDKTATDPVQLESTAGSDLYAGDREVGTYNPLFDATPPDLLAGVVTERGVLSPADVEGVADQLRELARWEGAGSTPDSDDG